MELNQTEGLSFEEIRDRYTEYLKTQNLSPLTVQTARSDTFYLLRHDPSLDFWAMLRSENFETEAFAHLQAALNANSKGSITSNISSYMAHLRRFRKFLYSNEKLPEVPPKHTYQNKMHGTVKCPQANIPAPSIQEVVHYQEAWEKLGNR